MLAKMATCLSHLIHPSAAPGFATAMGNSDHEGLPKQQNDTRTLVDKPLRSNQRWEDGIRGYDVNIHEIIFNNLYVYIYIYTSYIIYIL